MFENEDFRTYIKSGVIYIEYKKEEVLTLDIVKEAVKQRLKLANNVMMPLFIDFRKPKGGTKEVRTYLSSKESIEGLSAGAMWINSAITMIAFNIYMSFDTPDRPMKAFVYKEKALYWLEQFKNPNLN